MRVLWRTDREAGGLMHDGLHTTAEALSRRGAGARGMHGGRVRIRASKCARGGGVPGAQGFVYALTTIEMRSRGCCF